MGKKREGEKGLKSCQPSPMAHIFEKSRKKGRTEGV